MIFGLKEQKERRYRKMEEFVVKIIGYGVISWTILFFITRRKLPKRSYEFCNRLVSTAHAILAVLLASLSVQDWSCPVSPLASKSSPQQMRTLAVSVAYFIYDLIGCQFDKSVKVDNVIHHLVSIVGLGAGLAYQRCGSEMVAALWITEMSSPLLHLRELLKELGYRDTGLNLAVDVYKLFHPYFVCIGLHSSKDDRWTLFNICYSLCEQSFPHKGNGSGTATCEYFLVI